MKEIAEAIRDIRISRPFSRFLACGRDTTWPRRAVDIDSRLPQLTGFGLRIPTVETAGYSRAAPIGARSEDRLGLK